MDFGPFVNATWAGLPKPFQWARRLFFRRTLKAAEAPENKPTSTTSPALDTSREASFSQQAMNSDKMTNTHDYTTPPATKRAEGTVWGATWLAFLLSIIPVVVLTLSCSLTPHAKLSGVIVDLCSSLGGDGLHLGFAGHPRHLLVQPGHCLQRH
jgi:hypothetical protein